MDVFSSPEVIEVVSKDGTKLYQLKAKMMTVKYFAAMLNSGMKESSGSIALPYSAESLKIMLASIDGYHPDDLADHMSDRDLLEIMEIVDMYGLINLAWGLYAKIELPDHIDIFIRLLNFAHIDSGFLDTMVGWFVCRIANVTDTQILQLNLDVTVEDFDKSEKLLDRVIDLDCKYLGRLVNHHFRLVLANPAAAVNKKWRRYIPYCTDADVLRQLLMKVLPK